MSIRVGLTGGIGSGKTLVGEVFGNLGVPVFRADDQGRILLDTDPEIISEVSSLFGPDIYKQGTLDRFQVSEKVFKNKVLLASLNQIVHPKVILAFQEWAQEYASRPYVIMEAAILYETGADARLDTVIAVSAPEDLRIQRVVERDQVDPERVRQRIKNQWPENMIIDKSEYVISNDGIQMVLPQVLEIHKQLLKKNRGSARRNEQ